MDGLTNSLSVGFASAMTLPGAPEHIRVEDGSVTLGYRSALETARCVGEIAAQSRGERVEMEVRPQDVTVYNPMWICWDRDTSPLNIEDNSSENGDLVVVEGRCMECVGRLAPEFREQMERAAQGVDGFRLLLSPRSCSPYSPLEGRVCSPIPARVQ